MRALIAALGSTFTACRKAPDPVVKEGRFDFSVTYEVDGAVETASSVYVYGLEATRGYLLLKTVDDGEIYLDLNLSAKRFMADPHVDDDYDTDEPVAVSPRLFIEYSEAKYDEIGESYSEDTEVLEGYGVKIIEYDYDLPIENTYKNI